MRLLATITPEDVDANSPRFDYGSFKPRLAARAVVFDGNKVALVKIGKHDYYMLPGGGVESEDEDILSGLKREIREELGCKVKIMGEVGIIVVYFDRWSQKQTDHCYAAERLVFSNKNDPTEFELEEDQQIIWAESINSAISLMEKASPINRDGMLVRARDLLFLRAALET
jgi:8-oxo-dGTP pyrophosphatase MutT (NUDIX family)